MTAATLFENLVKLFFETALFKNIPARVSFLSGCDGVEDLIKFVRAVH